MMFHKCRNCSFSWWVMENCVKDEWCSHLPFLSVRRFSSSSFPHIILYDIKKTIHLFFSPFSLFPLYTVCSHYSPLNFPTCNMYELICITDVVKGRWYPSLFSIFSFFYIMPEENGIRIWCDDHDTFFLVPPLLCYAASTHFTCSWLKMLMWCDPFSLDAKTENILHIFITILSTPSSHLSLFCVIITRVAFSPVFSHVLPIYYMTVYHTYIVCLPSIFRTRPLSFSFKKRGNILVINVLGWCQCHWWWRWQWYDETMWWNYIFPIVIYYIIRHEKENMIKREMCPCERGRKRVSNVMHQVGTYKQNKNFRKMMCLPPLLRGKNGDVGFVS